MEDRKGSVKHLPEFLSGVATGYGGDHRLKSGFRYWDLTQWAGMGWKRVHWIQYKVEQRLWRVEVG